MTTYRSVHQSRIQTTIGGKIHNVGQYDRFYDIAYDAMSQGIFPAMMLGAGQFVLRVLDHVDGKPLDIDKARCIPPGSSSKGGNRFSGVRLDGRNGQGALYVGTVGGVLREHAHYSLQARPPSALRQPVPSLWKPGGPDSTKAFMQQQESGGMPSTPKCFYLFRLKYPLKFADLRLPALAAFLHRLSASGAVSGRYGFADSIPFDMLASAANDSQDYSAARGIADAVFDLRYVTGNAGVCALSSRADTDSGLVYQTHGDRAGGLIFAIMDKDGSSVSALEPAAAPFATFQEIAEAVR